MRFESLVEISLVVSYKFAGVFRCFFLLMTIKNLAFFYLGYTCIYKRRTGTKKDGCAVCYHSDRFTQLSINLLEFRQLDCELLNRDNVGIVLLLQPTAGQNEAFSPICVANTHLLFNPRRGDVKLAQLAIMFAEIDIMIKKCKSEGRRCEVVLCGDFNALPNSPLWNFITTGQLYYHGLPAWMVSDSTVTTLFISLKKLYSEFNLSI